MADGHGGYRKPSNPAPVSGPGRLSQRTDGGPAQGAAYIAGGDYGEGQELMTLQQDAAMSAAAPAPGPAGGYTPSGPAIQPVPLGADTAYPDEPITSGVDVGPGPGSEVMAVANMDREWIKQLTPYLPALEAQAQQPGASPVLRRYIRTIKTAVG